MNTLVEWKARLQPGTQIRQIWNSREGNVDHIFTIATVQTNGIFGHRSDLPGRRSWMSFPKRGEIEFTETGWRRFEGNTRVAEYTWISPEGEPQP